GGRSRFVPSQAGASGGADGPAETDCRQSLDGLLDERPHWSRIDQSIRELRNRRMRGLLFALQRADITALQCGCRPRASLWQPFRREIAASPPVWHTKCTRGNKLNIRRIAAADVMAI